MVKLGLTEDLLYSPLRTNDLNVQIVVMPKAKRHFNMRRVAEIPEFFDRRACYIIRAGVIVLINMIYQKQFAFFHCDSIAILISYVRAFGDIR